jgi:hypothetical protein
VNEASNAKCASLFVSDSVLPATGKTRATAKAVSKKSHSYKLLLKFFRHNGFAYKKVARESDAAIYEQTWSGSPNSSISYEVIRVRRREGFQIGGRFVEPAEVYPNSEAWGVNGFTLSNRDAAFAKLREIAKS